MSEFSLIDLIHEQISVRREDVVLGSGDDCAVLQPPAGKQLAITTDTLIAGRHFPLDTPAHAIGYKALAVNLSDLAAMGAEPAWVSLALSMPKQDGVWLAEFARGFAVLAEQHGVQLTGGDTTCGALSITVTAVGFVEPGQDLRRAGAQAGDDIYVSGHLGQAGYELRHQSAPELRKALNYPVPRVQLGQALVSVASAAIDISDGLLADLGHILAVSGALGAEIALSRLPVATGPAALTAAEQWELVLAAGDEYELCFTAKPGQRESIAHLAGSLGLALTRIGHVCADGAICLVKSDGSLYHLSRHGFDHFFEE